MVVLTKQLLALQLAAVGASVIDGVNSLPVKSDLSGDSAVQGLETRFTKARIGVALENGTETKAFPNKRDDLTTLSLKKIDVTQGTDPLVAFQHHVNRANVKLAKMTGRASFPKQVNVAEGAKLRRRGLAIPSQKAKRASKEQHGNTVDEGGLIRLSRRGADNEGHPDYDSANLIRLSRRDLSFKHGRVGVVLKGQSPDNALSDASKGKRNSLRRRLFGSLFDGLLTRDMKIAATPMAGADSDDVSYAKRASSSAAGRVAAAKDDASAGYSQKNLAAAINGGLTSASAPTAQGSLGLDIEANDVGYVATIQIGAEKKDFRMLIDSGSADTWVPSQACTGCGSGHQQLGKKTSSSFRSLAGSSFGITYGTGAVKGTLGNDDVTISGMTIKNHTLGLATEETVDFSDPAVPFDGLMGLARMELSNAETPTPIDALYANGLVPAPVMGYHLGRVADGENDGEVTFGGVDSMKYDGDLLEIPNVSTQGFWEAAVDGISFAGQDLNLNGRTAILDTGTSLIVAPQADADAVHAAIPGSKSDGQGGYTIPCTTTDTFSFTFSGQSFDIDPRDMMFLPVDQNDLTGDCVSSISAGSVGGPNEWLVGAAFLKNVYFATNAEVNMIGLAKLRTEASASSIKAGDATSSGDNSSASVTATSLGAAASSASATSSESSKGASTASSTSTSASPSATATDDGPPLLNKPSSSSTSAATATSTPVTSQTSASAAGSSAASPSASSADEVPPLLKGASSSSPSAGSATSTAATASSTSASSSQSASSASASSASESAKNDVPPLLNRPSASSATAATPTATASSSSSTPSAGAGSVSVSSSSSDAASVSAASSSPGPSSASSAASSSTSASAAPSSSSVSANKGTSGDDSIPPLLAGGANKSGAQPATSRSEGQAASSNNSSDSAAQDAGATDSEQVDC